MKSRKYRLLIIGMFALLFLIGCEKVNPAANNIDSKVQMEIQKDDNKQQHEADKATQQILDDNKFLKSQEGLEFQANSWKLAKAYFNGNKKYIRDNLLDLQKDIHCYNVDKGFSKIDYMIFRFTEYDPGSKSAKAEYIVKMENTDSLAYFDFTLKLINGKWKIVSYGLDA